MDGGRDREPPKEHGTLRSGGLYADFARYGISARELRERYPDARIVRIVGFETEDHDLPLNHKDSLRS